MNHQPAIRFTHLWLLVSAFSLQAISLSHAADFTVPAGGSLPAVASLDASGSNTITLEGDITLPAAYSITAAASRHFHIQADDANTWRTITKTGAASAFFSIATTGEWGVDHVILTGGNATTAGGAISFASTSGMITLNGDFIAKNNTTTNVGGALYSGGANLVLTGSTAFTKNQSTSSGGAIHARGDLVFEEHTYFEGNVASGAGGAIFFNTNGNALRLEKGGVFISNTTVGTANHSGAIQIRGDFYIAGSSTFLNNTAGSGNGGAIFMFTQGGITASGTFDATIGDIVFRGNTTNGGTTRNAMSIRINVADGSRSNVHFHTGDGADAHTIAFYDPITSYAGGADNHVEIRQTGDGILLFDTFNSNPYVNTAVESGIFRLTNNAGYGHSGTIGNFTLHAPATLSGNGTVRGSIITLAAGSTLEVLGGGALTLVHNNPLVAGGGLTLLGSGTINASGALSAAVISIGTLTSADPELPDATVNSAQTLSFAANTPLTLENGGIIQIDLFGSAGSDLLEVGAFTIAGSGTINLVGASDGSYKIITTTNDISAAGLTRTVNGGALTSRYTADLRYENLGAETWVDFTTKNLAQTWTGAAGSHWKNSQTSDANWTDGASSLPELFFLDGDRVTFGNTGAGVVTIDAASVTVADMTVNATSDYTFAGDGGITANTTSSSGLATAATGKLVKTGAGTLNFANTGGNTFSGGIEIEEGVVAFTRAGQLGDGGNGITFSNSSTLRAGTGTVGLDNTLILMNATTTAVVEVVAGGTLTHTGLIQATAGTFAKSGSGMLVLDADNSASFAATLRVDAGSLLLAQGARLGGAALVSTGGIFGGSGSASSITVHSGGILQVGMPGTNGTLHAGALDLAAGTTLNYTLFAGNQSSMLQVGAPPVLAAGSITDNYTINISEWIVGTYSLGNIAALEDATLNLRGDFLNARQVYTTAIVDGQLEITLLPTANAILVWGGSNAAGVNNGRWNSTAENWKTSGVAYAFADYDAAVFDDTVLAPAFREVEIMSVMVASDIAVTGDGDYRFIGTGGITGDASGAVGITGAGTLTKTGAGTLTFANTGGNLFTGGINIGGSGTQGGLIAFDRANQLAVGGAAAINFLSSGTLRALADIAATGTLGSAITIAGGVNATLDTGAFEVAYSGALSAAGAGATLAKTGAGTLRLTGASASASLTVDVTQGSVLLDGGSLGTAASVRSGALFGGSGAAASVSMNANSTLQLGLGGSDGALHIAALQLADGSTIAGRGTLSGSTAINGNVTAIIADSTRITLSATTGGSGMLVKTGAGTLVYSNTNALGHAATSIDAGMVMMENFTSFPVASGSHTFILNGGWLDLSNSTYDPTGDTANDWSGLVLTGDSGRVIGSNDRITLRAGSMGFDIGSSTKQGVFVVVDAGPGGVATMTGANIYAGYTLLKSGLLQVAADNQLGDTTLNREIIFDGGGLQITGDGFTSSRGIELRGDGTISVPQSTSATLGGNITGAGAFTKDGSGTLILGGTASHNGGTVITAGTLRGNTDNLKGNITNNGRLVFAQAADGDFAGTITGASGIVSKTGAGNLTLSGALAAATFNLEMGTLAVPGGKILATAQFNNYGTLKIGKAGGGSGHGRVTIGGDYTGSDGQLFLGLQISGTTVEYDQLHIAGNANGSTTVDFGQLVITTPLPAGTLPDDIISWDGVAEPGAFEQSNNSIIEIGGIQYSWEINAGSSAGAWIADPIATAPAMLGADAAALLIGKAALASLSQRMQVFQFGNRAHSLELWANGMHRHDNITANAYKGLDANTQGVQVGADWGTVKANKNFMALGAFCDYAKSDLHTAGRFASTRADSTGMGIYYVEKIDDWYVNIILRYAQSDYHVSVPGWHSFSTKGESYGVSAEVGRTMRLYKKMIFQPQIQVTGQHIEIDDTIDSFGRRYRVYNTDSLEARVGAAVMQDFHLPNRRIISVYARGSYAYDFDAESEIHVVNTASKNNLGGGFAMLNMGASMRLSRRLAAGVDAAWYYGSKAEGYSINLNVACMW